MSARRAGPTASAMRRRALVCWALLLALGLCRARRARPRNVLLILGECAPADPPPPRPHSSRPPVVAPPQQRSVLTPALKPSPSPLTAAPRLFFAAPCRGRQGSLAHRGDRGLGSTIRHPTPAAGSDPSCVPSAPGLTLRAGRFPKLGSTDPRRDQPEKGGWCFRPQRPARVPWGAHLLPIGFQTPRAVWVGSPSPHDLPALFPNPTPSQKPQVPPAPCCSRDFPLE